MHMILNLFECATLGTTISSPKLARFYANPVEPLWTEGSTWLEQPGSHGDCLVSVTYPGSYILKSFDMNGLSLSISSSMVSAQGLPLSQRQLVG